MKEALVAFFPTPQPHAEKAQSVETYVADAFKHRGFRVEINSTMTGLTKKDFLQKVIQKSIDAGTDLCALYIGGHGIAEGLITALVDTPLESAPDIVVPIEVLITPEELFDALGYRKGPTFIVLEVCHSGVFGEYLQSHPRKNTIVSGNGGYEITNLVINP